MERSKSLRRPIRTTRAEEADAELPEVGTKMSTTKSHSNLFIIVSNGSKLTVREVSEPIMEYRSWGVGSGPPLPIINKVVNRNQARRIIEDVMGGDYDRVV